MRIRCQTHSSQSSGDEEVTIATLGVDVAPVPLDVASEYLTQTRGNSRAYAPEELLKDSHT
jgi:hypothetical protein